MSDPIRRERKIEAAWTEHPARSAGWGTRRYLPSLCEAQNWRCCYCGGRMDGTGQEPDAPSVEHVLPRSMGGTDDVGNLAAAHRRCNEARGSAWRREHVEALGGVE